MRIHIPVLLAFCLLFTGFSPAQQKAEVCIGDTCVKADVAADEASRARGLMYREKLGENEGMLFVFETAGTYAFWMKNMRIPLDFIWITPDLRVGALNKDVPPCGVGDCTSFGPVLPVRYVLEVEAGFIAKHHIALGDKISIR